MLEIMDRNRDEMDINTMSPLVWAYVGDCVYELYVRSYLVNTTKQKPHQLHIHTIEYVKASAQANILRNIQPNLTEAELDIVRRGRNVQNHHLPKNADPEDYMYATAFEALIGYLYLTKKDKRLQEILKDVVKMID